MTISLASLLSTLLLSSCIILIQILLIKKMRINHYLSATLLMIVSLVFIVRLILPVEFFYAYTLPSDQFLPKLDVFFHKEILQFYGQSIDIGFIIISIWLVGALFFLIRFFLKFHKIHKLKRLITLSPSYSYKNKKIFIVDQPISPLVIGIVDPVVVLPKIDLSVKQQKFILEHELFHISSLDIWIKYTYEVISAIYWWNPVVYIFRNSFNQIIELKADEFVTADLSKKERIEYVETLVKIGKTIKSSSYETSLSFFPSFSSTNSKYLLERADNIFVESKRKPSKLVLLVATLFCFYLSSCVIFEAYKSNPVVSDSTIGISPEDSFLVRTDTNQFKVYNHGTFLFEVSDEDRKQQFPKLKVFETLKEGEKYIEKNN